MEPRKPGKLRLVHQIGEEIASEPGVDFVIIPGVWNENSPARMKGSCSWVRPLAASTTSDTRVFLFTYQLELDGSSLWEQLLGQSYALISDLDENRALPGYHLRPLLFICHSLGGLILKKALTLGVRSRQAYQDATSGIIFLGCPHLVATSADGWVIVKLLMKANRKDISKQNMTDSEMDGIISTCRQFDDLQLTIPILSVYERRETKFQESIFKIRRKKDPAEVLVSRAMVQIHAHRESVFEVDKTHLDLIDVEEIDPLYTQLIQFFSTFVHHAPKNVQYSFRQIPQNEFQNLNLRARSSISSFSEVSSSTPGMKVYTPQTRSSDLATQTHATLPQFEMPQIDTPQVEDDFGSLHNEGVQLPFSHTGSMIRNPRFYGRADAIDEIDYAFGLKNRSGSNELQTFNQEGDLNATKTYVLCGMAGIGKTEIASEYLYSRRGHFDAVIWIYADTTRKLGAQFVTLAKELSKGAISDGTDEVSAREFVKGWLAVPVGYRKEKGRSVQVEATWLMVFDNADEPDVLYDWLPSQGPGCILVTSKYPYVKENAYRLERGLDLETFSPEAGGDMLRKLSGREGEADAVNASMRISNTLGGLPLALFQMSAIIRKHHLTFKDFEDWYREDSRELHYLRVSGMQTNYQHTIGTAWAIEQLSESALAFLNVLSVLDPDRIPEEMLMDGAKEVKLPHYPVRKHTYFSARAELIHASLVTRNMAANELRVHRLIQEVVRQKMNEDSLRAVYASVAVLISAVWPYVSGTDPTRNQAWRVPIAEKYTPHICKFAEVLGPEIRDGKYDGTATSGYIFSSYGWYISERGIPEQTEIFASLAQRILDKAVNRDLGDEERITHWLGEAHHSLSLAACLTGSSDGTEHANTWLDILHDRIKKYNQASDKLALATAYNQMGICLVNKDQIRDAMANFQKSVTTFRSVENAPQFSGTFPALSLSNLFTLQGQPNEGERVLTPVLEEHERILGRDDTSTTESGHIWRVMGHIRYAQQRYEEAFEYHERALRNIKATSGNKHYFTGDCLYCLAVDLIEQGDYKRAIENLDGAIDAFESASHREAQAARAIWRKGYLLKEMGDDLASRQLFRKAMKLRRTLVPDDNRLVEELKDEDWTKLIIYWSR